MSEQCNMTLQDLMLVFAEELLGAAVECCEVYRLSRQSNAMRAQIRRIPAGRWMREYRHGRFGFVRGETAVKVLGLNPDSKEAAQLIQLMDALRVAASPIPTKVEAAIENLTEDGREEMEMLWNELQHWVVSEYRAEAKESPDANSEVLQQTMLADDPGVLFFVGVEVPCWFEFGSSARVLLENARTGDFEALKNILCLDPYALHDKRVCKAYWDIIYSDNEVRKKQLVEAMIGKGGGNLSTVKIKKRIAALVFFQWLKVHSALQELSKVLLEEGVIEAPIPLDELTYAGLQRLQDSIHIREYGAADPDMPDAVRSFEQAIRREVDDFVSRV